MRRVVPILLLMLTACAAQPPERSPLPDVEDVLPEAAGCRLNVGDPLGVHVDSVNDDGAASGLLQPGDIIMSLDGQLTSTRPELSEIMTDASPGDAIEVSFSRDGAVRTTAITLLASSTEPERGVLGITVQTAYETIGPEDANDMVSPSATARPIQIAGSLYLLDPLRHAWQRTGVTPPPTTRWVSTSSGLYTVSEDEPIAVLDLLTGGTVPDDGFSGWDALRLLGTVGDALLLLFSSQVTDQPDLVNLAIAGFDPRIGQTLWVSPVSNTFGVPAAAFGSPDDTAFVAIGADPESGAPRGVALFDAAGAPQSSDDVEVPGAPMGWFDETSMAFHTQDATVSVVDYTDGSTTSYDLPPHLAQAVTVSVGDGKHILVVGGRDLLLQDLTDPNFSAPLATDCTFGRIGEPGWGV